MKQDVFNQYVDRICDLFYISRESLFTKSKKREFSDARYLLYYLCVRRNIQPCYIEKYMTEGGYAITHSTILHGVGAASKKVQEDSDYASIIKEIERSV
jgi:chromosomal replication initiator protein